MNVTGFSQNDGFVALNNSLIDVLAGGKVDKKYDFANPSLGLQGFEFSTAIRLRKQIYWVSLDVCREHFSENLCLAHRFVSDDVSIFALATREDNVLFSSFVNCVVWATIYAQENAIVGKQSNFMPFLPWFGKDFE